LYGIVSYGVVEQLYRCVYMAIINVNITEWENYYDIDFEIDCSPTTLMEMMTTKTATTITSNTTTIMIILSASMTMAACNHLKTIFTLFGY